MAFDIALMVHQARVHAGLSQEALAKRIGTKQASISRLENGRSLPSIRFLLQIAVALKSYLIPPQIASLKEVISYRKYYNSETTHSKINFANNGDFVDRLFFSSLMCMGGDSNQRGSMKLVNV